MTDGPHQLLKLHDFAVGDAAVHVKYFRKQHTWFEAQKICQDEGGRLATEKDSTLSCDKLEGDFVNGLTFWSGEYTTMSDWISREGCYQILGITEVSLQQSLSECFEGCRQQNISLRRFAYNSRDHQCVCLHGNEDMKQHESHNCSDFIKLNTSYFLYKVMQKELKNGTGNCAFVDCQNKQIYPASCIDERSAFCGNFTRGFNWKMSQEKCKYIVHENLSAVCEMPHHVSYRRSIWLPIQKLTVRTKTNDDGIYNEKDITECAYYHCYHRQTVHPMHANTTCKFMTGGFFCVFSNGKKWGTNSTDYLEHTATSHTAIIIGGVIGTTVLIVVIVLIIVYKFRCKNAASKKANASLFALNNGQSPTYEDHHKNKSSSNDKMFNNKLYDEQCLPPCKIVPDESIKNKINNREDCRRQNDDYSVPMKTKKTEQSTQEEDSKDGNDVESEYDILNKTRRSLNNALEHNVYDSTIASRCESDPTYNTSTNILSNRKNIDDMYDRF